MQEITQGILDFSDCNSGNSRNTRYLKVVVQVMAPVLMKCKCDSLPVDQEFQPKVPRVQTVQLRVCERVIKIKVRPACGPVA